MTALPSSRGAGILTGSGTKVGGGTSNDAPACRPGCGACCTAPSISSAIPGMPGGKPAGVACVQLDAALRCQLFGSPQRPAVCASLRPSAEMCGTSSAQAMLWLGRLEALTAPPS